MPTFNKSRGFKLKSGNTIPFKEMGSSPIQQGQADATLVTAAKAAAMANVPKDLSAQFNKTAEGVIAANKGKTEMLTTLAKEAPGILTAVGRGISKGVGKIKQRFAAKKAFEKYGSGVEHVSKKERRKISDKLFEESYQEKHKDRKSIADIRKMTGADGSVADKDRDYEQEYKQQKYKDKIANKKKNKEKGNGKDNGKGNDTIKLKKTDLSKGLANSNKGSGGFGTDINQY